MGRLMNLETYIYIAQEEIVKLAQRHNKQDSNCFLDALRRLIWSTSHNEFEQNLDNCISWIFNGIEKIDIFKRQNEVKRIIYQRCFRKE